MHSAMSIMNKGHVKTVEPPVKTKPEIDVEVLTAIDPNTLEDSFVYVHCYYHNVHKDMLIRIWRTTYLIDQSSATKAQLIHAENISFAPVWTLIPDGVTYSFLLIFSGLPKSCRQFSLVEEISQPGGFRVDNITRNETDVYHINI
jgi:hypothetical protein